MSWMDKKRQHSNLQVALRHSCQPANETLGSEKGFIRIERLLFVNVQHLLLIRAPHHFAGPNSESV